MDPSQTSTLKYNSQEEMFASLFPAKRPQSADQQEENRKVFTATSVTLTVVVNLVFVLAFIF